MPKLTLRPLAKKDIKKIWQYSYENWGKPQADKYTSDLGLGIQALVSNPEKGKSVDFVRMGYWQLNVQKHYVMYRLKDNEIEIVRILGKRMDITRHI